MTVRLTIRMSARSRFVDCALTGIWLYADCMLTVRGGCADCVLTGVLRVGLAG